MYTVLTANGDHIVELAARGTIVRVIRQAVLLVDHECRPGVRIRYQSDDGKTAWVFVEERAADATGWVDMEGTVWSRLKANFAKLEVVHVSGSV